MAPRSPRMQRISMMVGPHGLGGAMLAAALLGCGTATAADDRTMPAPAMMEAGVAAAGESLTAPPADKERAVAAIYQAMFSVAWQPIDSAPKDGSFILLGTWDGSQFLTGIGNWVVFDDPLKPGHWSLEEWWPSEPSYWAAVPPAPMPD